MKEFTINGTVMQCYPLSAAVKAPFYSLRYSPTQILCIGTGLYIRQDDVDFGVLKQAIYKAYTMMDSMRLRFVRDEDGTVYQYVAPFEEREIEFFDFSRWNEEDAHNEMRRWTAVPFERFNSPMNKVVMVKLPDGYNGIYLKVDHMTMDSSSIIGFHRAVLEIYCNIKYNTGAPSEMYPYIEQLKKDLAYEDNSPAKQKDREFWLAKLAESEPMYTDFSGPGRLITQRRENNNPKQRWATIVSRSPEASISVYQLEKEPSERLLRFCAENHVPVVCLLLMGLRTVLSKFNNDEKDVSVKTCIARRGTLSEKYSGGTRVHFFPLRTIIEPETTFLDAIKTVQTEQMKILRHANFDPVEYTMMRAQAFKYQPGGGYESISLTYQPLTMNDRTKQQVSSMPDIPYKSYWYTNGVAAQPLYLTVMHRPEDNGLSFNFEYKKDAVTEHEMEYFYYYLCRVLFRGIEDKDRTVGEILEMI